LSPKAGGSPASNLEPLAPTCAPPLPLERRPDFIPPAGAWDCHCHVFGPVSKFPYDEHRTYTPPEAPAEVLMHLHATLGFDHAVLVQPGAHGVDHGALLDALDKAQGRYRGVMLVEADQDTIDFAELHARGIRGVRFNLVPHLGQPPDPAFVKAISATVARLGWHFLVHAGPDQLDQLAPFLNLGLPIVIDHMARLDAAAGIDQPAFRRVIELLSHPSCWIKVSGIDRVSQHASPFADAIPLARRFVEAAPQRCLWGTDFPHPNHKRVPDDADLVDLIPAIVPDAALQRLLLIDNPQRLYS
jgi:2-pyrone-4,6-dicarboxylate lactonase